MKKMVIGGVFFLVCILFLASLVIIRINNFDKKSHEGYIERTSLERYDELFTYTVSENESGDVKPGNYNVHIDKFPEILYVKKDTDEISNSLRLSINRNGSEFIFDIYHNNVYNNVELQEGDIIKVYQFEDFEATTVMLNLQDTTKTEEKVKYDFENPVAGFYVVGETITAEEAAEFNSKGRTNSTNYWIQTNENNIRVYYEEEREDFEVEDFEEGDIIYISGSTLLTVRK